MDEHACGEGDGRDLVSRVARAARSSRLGFAAQQVDKDFALDV
jgi:hypothetical protein